MITFKNAEEIEIRIEHLGAKIKRSGKKPFPLAVIMPCRFQIICAGKREVGQKGEKLLFKDFNTPSIIPAKKKD